MIQELLTGIKGTFGYTHSSRYSLHLSRNFDFVITADRNLGARSSLRDFPARFLSLRIANKNIKHSVFNIFMSHWESTLKPQ